MVCFWAGSMNGLSTALWSYVVKERVNEAEGMRRKSLGSSTEAIRGRATDDEGKEGRKDNWAGRIADCTSIVK